MLVIPLALIESCTLPIPLALGLAGPKLHIWA